jgi:hypothetical protein
MIYQHVSRDRDEAMLPRWEQLSQRPGRAPADRDRARTGRAAGVRLPDLVTVASDYDSELGFWVGAGEGNRTLMTSLEGWGSTIELRPQGGCHA